MLAKTVTKPQNTSSALSRRFSVAPMMDWTDRHCRFFLRLLSKHALLYTEITSASCATTTPSTRLRFNWAAVFPPIWPPVPEWPRLPVTTK